MVDVVVNLCLSLKVIYGATIGAARGAADNSCTGRAVPGARDLSEGATIHGADISPGPVDAAAVADRAKAGQFPADSVVQAIRTLRFANATGGSVA